MPHRNAPDLPSAHSTPPRIVLATANPHKLTELHAIFTAQSPTLAHSLCTLGALPGSPFPEPDETGTTFLLNATIKATTYAALTGLPCLADDSGLSVDALCGAPGVISSHYATNGRETGLTRDQRDHANNAKLLADLAQVPFDARTARFTCVMALALPPTQAHPQPRVIAHTTGTFEGRIGLHHTHADAASYPQYTVPRGNQGFGYDPLLLLPPDFTTTAAQLEPADKNARSHRAKAATDMATRILQLFTCF